MRGTRRIAVVSLEAARLRLYPGQKATDAFAIAPELVTEDTEPEADAAALEALVDWCVRYSPAVAADAPDGLFLDITGVDHLWGGEAELLADFQARLLAAGLPFRCAIADTPAAAWGLAHYGRDGTIAPPGGQLEALGPLPPAALRLDPETAAQIGRLGFRRLSQLFALPRAPLAKRFGKQTLMRLDQALGRTREALSFRRPPTPWIARLAFAEPISAPEDMARVALDAAAKLCARLEREGKGARRFELYFHRLDGKSPSVAAGLALPGRDARRIAKLLTPKIEAVDPGFGIEVVTITASEVETLSGRQVKLEGAAQPGIEDGLSPLIDRLVNRLGEDRVWRAAPVESHVPELSAGRVGPLSPPSEAKPWDPQTPRPIRLFRRPEPLEGVIALTPDDPPTQFRWRGQLHRVRRAEGPERIGEAWWTREIEDVRVGHVRDYYRVEDAEGGRFWLFRAGLYDSDAPARWWLHGLFG
ncbi:MAG: Nucleotidyltransferase/DNA polymerase involved in repair [Phenylobacterium sp.]|nr:Nucleotidyltransferase/DNA polymerase involved in repair [Phenylobacterium sp.]